MRAAKRRFSSVLMRPRKHDHTRADAAKVVPFVADKRKRPEATLASRLITAQEEERRRVAREIHDDLCQELAALTFDVGGLLAESLPVLRSRLRSFQDRLKNLSIAARRLAYRLHPSSLESLGIAASLRALCYEFSRRNGVVVRFKSRQLPSPLPLPLMSCLYRIAQEGVRNAVKHSGAKHIFVTLIGAQKTIALSIRDDGAGFDLRSTKRKSGLGLASMDERIRLIGGKLSIDSAPGHGTTIVALAPLSRNGS